MLKNLKQKYINKETADKLLNEGKGMLVEEVKSTIQMFLISLVLKTFLVFALIGAVMYGYNYVVNEVIQKVKTETVTSIKEKVEEGKAVTGAIVDKVNKDKDKISSIVDSVKEKSSSALEEQKQKVNSIIEKNLGEKNETK